MSQSVIDGLEAVEVEPQHREGLPGPLCAREGFLEPFPEEEPVWKVRQDIVSGRVKDARLGRFPLRHVGVRPNGAASRQRPRADLKDSAVRALPLINMVDRLEAEVLDPILELLRALPNSLRSN